MDVINGYRRYENESTDELIYRICQDKDKIGTWDDVAKVINSLTGDDYGESTYRKKFQAFQKMLAANQSKFVDTDEQLKEIRLERQKLEKERVKTRDERNELRRTLREEARKESYKEQILRSISEFQSKPLDYDKNKQFTGVHKSDNDLVCTVFDVHTGLNVNNYFNVFNEDVLKNRLNNYIDKILEVQSRHGSRCLTVIMSELVNGIIHLALRIENNQNLIEQFLTITNYMAEFLSELSYHFEDIDVYVCPGNHSRCQAKKDDNMRGENMDLLVIPYLQAKLQNFKNILFHENTIDSSIAMFTSHGQKIFAVHGDKDSMTNVVQKLTMYTSIQPDIILMGHKHTNAMLTSYNTKVIQAGCLSGGGDEFCMDKRLKNKAEQVIIVINDSGLDCLYDVKFG